MVVHINILSTCIDPFFIIVLLSFTVQLFFSVQILFVVEGLSILSQLLDMASLKYIIIGVNFFRDVFFDFYLMNEI